MLETVSTDDLWAELQKRFNSCVLSFTKDAKDRDTSYSNLWWKGSTTEILGLTRYADMHAVNNAKLGLFQHDDSSE